jgi:uncharacterized protein DUF4012
MGSGVTSHAGSDGTPTAGRPDDPAGSGTATAGAGTLSIRHVAARPAPSRQVPRPHRSRSPQRERWAVRAVVAACAVAGAAVDVAPSGAVVADRAMAAGVVALVAAAGSTARRWTWFAIAGGALALAQGRPAVACAAVALALALASTSPIRPSPAVGAAASGLAALALLRATDLGFHGSSALTAAALVAPVLVSGYRHAGRRCRRRTRLAVVAAVTLVGVVAVAYGAAALSARSDVERGVDRLRHGLEAGRAGEDEAAAGHLDAAADAFAAADGRLGGWLGAPAQLLPGLGHNARAAEAMAAEAAAVAREGADAAAAADVDTLTVEGGRLDLDRVRSLERPLDAVASAVAGAIARVDDVDAAWLIPPVADRLDTVEGELAAAAPDVELAATASRLVPAMFGGQGASRWFVAFVTPAEARGRTGLLGNFAELTAVDGQVDMTHFGRARELEAGGTPGRERTLSGPDDYLARWARFDPAATWRNVTMSPDFPSVGQVITELYPQSGGERVDGVIAIDPIALAALLEFTGPISVPGVEAPLTPDTAADYLLRQQYLTGDNATRIDALESLARQTFQRLTTGNLPGPRTIADVLGQAVARGHVHAYAVEPEQQDLFRSIGIDGALPRPRGGDYIGVVNNNAAGNKIDLYLARQLDYAATWDPDTGDIEATATVTLTNSAPSAGLPRYVIGSPRASDRTPPPGTNRTYLSIYSPWTADEVMLDGRPATFERQREGGRYAYSLFVDLPPEGGVRTVRLSLRGRLARPDAYRLVVGTQPLVIHDRLALTVDVAGDDRVTAVRDALVDEVTSYEITAGR